MRPNDERIAELAGRVADAEELDLRDCASGDARLDRTLRRLHDLGAISAAFGESWAAADDGQPTVGSGKAPTVLFTWGPFEVREEIGAGSHGRVYRAWEPGLEREVALKLLPVADDPAARETALAEAKRLARVRHPHVLTVHGADVRDGQVGIWAELITGETCEERLRGTAGFAEEEIRRSGIELCGALGALHAAGIIHGDVKAANVMQDASGRTVLLDLGSALGQTDHPEAGGFISPLSAAPECLEGTVADERSDIYSLGVILHRMAAGAFPHPADTMAELKRRHSTGERTPLGQTRPDLAGDLVGAIEQALAADPAKRQATTAEFGAALGKPPVARGITARVGVMLVAALILVTTAWVGLQSNPLDAAAEFRRGGEGFKGTLISDTSLRLGDALYCDFVADRDAWVYILNEDRAGNLTVLYPVPGLAPANPLAGGKTHRLPGARDGVSQDWQLTTRGGEETLLVIAAASPVPELEDRLATLPVPTGTAPVQYAAIDTTTWRRLRGIGGLVPADPQEYEVGAARLAILAERCRSLQAQGRDLWWEMQTVRVE